jgi:arylamine N-acetyltransferase
MLRNWWTISRDNSAGDREAVLQFNTFPQTPQEFIAANMKSAMDPESIFVRNLLVNLRTGTGSLSVADDTFTLRSDGETRVTRIDGEGDLRGILEAHFGIVDLS